MSYFRSLPGEGTIRDIFRQYPEVFAPWGETTEQIMNGPAPLNRAERELIGAYVSALNACGFCYGVHGGIAQAWGLQPGLLESLVEDVDSADLDDKFKVLLKYVRKLTLTPSRMTQGDVDTVLAAGWDEQALQFAIFVACRFAFMNRLVDAYGIPALDEAGARAVAGHFVEHGYRGVER